MKQSIGLVILQIIGIILGFVSVFLVAGSLPAKEFAIVGIYYIISSIIVVFSNTGFETYAIRNILAWKEAGKINQVKLVVTQSIFYRTVLAFIITFPVILYSLYVSRYKFDGEYLSLFIIMGFFSVFMAMNDSIILILKGFNKYFYSALVSYSVNVFGKILALFLFVKYGFIVYIYTILFLPLLLTIPVIYMLKDYISIKGVLSKRMIKRSMNESKSFAVSAYLGYILGSVDQFLVSIFMSADILGTFTVAKNIFAMSKTFIENIFDPMIQNLVRYKNNLSLFTAKLQKIFKIKNVLLIISVLFLPVLIFIIDDIINLLNLSHYLYLKNYIILIYLSAIVSIAMKIKYNFICMFFPQNFYLKLTVVNSFIYILIFVLVSVINIKFLFINVLITNIFMLLYSEFTYKNKKNPYYYEVCIKR